MEQRPSVALRRILAVTCLLVISLTLSASRTHHVLAHVSLEELEPGMLKAIVVMRAASGKSYMADRDAIARMPRLASEEEMARFISTYRADDETVQAVIASLQEQGLSVTTHDDIFAFVVGTPEQFEQLVSPEVLERRLSMSTPDSEHAIFTGDELRSFTSHIDGLIVYPWREEQPEPTSTLSEPEISTSIIQGVSKCPDASITVDEVMRYLAVDRAHARGITGRGVRIGFVDKAVYKGHPFFLASPPDIQSYRFVGGQITKVGNSFSPLAENLGHGTMVAAYLHAAAPGAQLLSFALPVAAEPWEAAPSSGAVAEYLNYMHVHNLVDVISLSVGWFEEDASASVIAEVRTQLVYAISKGSVILVAAGNTGQEGKSGHNSVAAIPEVIAVGGATVNDFLDFSAAGGYDVDGITGAASFDSAIFQGRHVPDVVGIFGDNLCFPYPEENSFAVYNSSWGINGTSGATPQIAGIVALLIEQNPSITPTQIRAVLEESALDITTGQSGDGDYASKGYDAATGYGLPLATWVLNEQVVLHKGWNLIGLLKEHGTSYSAVTMLNEINGQGGACDSMSYWYSGSYRSVLIDDGEVYGFDFTLTPDLGYWVRCRSMSLWKPSGTSYVRSPRTLNLRTGWNLIAIPHSNVACSVDDLGYETGWSCWRVVEYDGQMQDWQDAGAYSFGNNYLLRAGRGYFVRCDEAVTWTPDCSRWVSAAQDSRPRNVLSSWPAPSIAFAGDAWRPADGTAPQQVEAISASISNISDQQFSVYWTTAVPTEGAVLLTNGYQGAVVFKALDDRGAHFSGTTHHITLRGLQAETTYYFAVLSGGTVAYDSASGQPFRVTTGKVLSTPGNRYNLHGSLKDADTHYVYDALVTVSLGINKDSGMLSVPIGFGVDDYASEGYNVGEGYSIVLDNARDSATGEYMDYLGAEHLVAEAIGNAGDASAVVDIDLGTSPNIRLDFMLSKQAPTPSMGLSPLPGEAIQVLEPTFRLYSFDKSPNNVTYRIELSRDNFATLERVYDQRYSTVGWSANSYPSGRLASFVPSEPLKNLVGYQWRAYAHNGEVWGPVSKVSTFAVQIPVEIRTVFLPVILRVR